MGVLPGTPLLQTQHILDIRHPLWAQTRGVPCFPHFRMGGGRVGPPGKPHQLKIRTAVPPHPASLTHPQVPSHGQRAPASGSFGVGPVLGRDPIAHPSQCPPPPHTQPEPKCVWQVAVAIATGGTWATTAPTLRAKSLSPSSMPLWHPERRSPLMGDQAQGHVLLVSDHPSEHV